MGTEHYLVPERSVAGGGERSCVSIQGSKSGKKKKVNILNEKLDFLFSTDLKLFIPLEGNTVNI
jgi:hypothetical protein